MNTTERQALVKIVKARFEVLRGQLEVRRDEIAEVVRERLRSESAEATKTYSAQAKKIVAEAQKLQEKARALSQAARQDGGVEVTRDSGGWRRQSSILVFSELNGGTPEDWQPVGLEKRVSEELRKLHLEARTRELNLDEQEAMLLEQIWTDALESEQAKELLSKIPTVDTLMPLPNSGEVKEIAS